MHACKKRNSSEEYGVPKNTQRGFLKLIAVIVITLSIFAYFGFDVRKVMDSPKFKESVTAVWRVVKESTIKVREFVFRGDENKEQEDNNSHLGTTTPAQ